VVSREKGANATHCVRVGAERFGTLSEGPWFSDDLSKHAHETGMSHSELASQRGFLVHGLMGGQIRTLDLHGLQEQWNRRGVEAVKFPDKPANSLSRLTVAQTLARFNTNSRISTSSSSLELPNFRLIELLGARTN
jgi:hypothetical protein